MKGVYQVPHVFNPYDVKDKKTSVFSYLHHSQVAGKGGHLLAPSRAPSPPLPPSCPADPPLSAPFAARQATSQGTSR